MERNKDLEGRKLFWFNCTTLDIDYVQAIWEDGDHEEGSEFKAGYYLYGEIEYDCLLQTEVTKQMNKMLLWIERQENKKGD